MPECGFVLPDDGSAESGADALGVLLLLVKIDGVDEVRVAGDTGAVRDPALENGEDEAASEAGSKEDRNMSRDLLKKYVRKLYEDCEVRQSRQQELVLDLRTHDCTVALC